jgi:hypothetical protein
MTSPDLLTAIRARGCRLSVRFGADGVTPTFGGPLTDEDRKALAEHREALVALLLAEARLAAAQHDDDDAAADRPIRWDERKAWTWLKAHQ